MILGGGGEFIAGHPSNPPGLGPELESQSVGEKTPLEGKVPNPLPNQRKTVCVIPDWPPLERWFGQNAVLTPLPFPVRKHPSPERVPPNGAGDRKICESVSLKRCRLVGSCGEAGKGDMGKRSCPRSLPPRYGSRGANCPLWGGGKGKPPKKVADKHTQTLFLQRYVSRDKSFCWKCTENPSSGEGLRAYCKGVMKDRPRSGGRGMGRLPSLSPDEPPHPVKWLPLNGRPTGLRPAEALKCYRPNHRC